MAVVYEEEHEGYRLCMKPIEKYECWIIAPDGSEIYEREIEDSEYSVFRYLRDKADDHLRDKEIEEERIEEERLAREAEEAQKEEAQKEEAQKEASQ